MKLRLGSSAILVLGVLLLSASIAHHILELSQINSNIGPVVALVINGGLATLLTGSGTWLRQANITSSEEQTVAIWTVFGGIVGGGLESLIIIVHLLEGRPLAEPEFHLLTGISSGGLMLFVAGYFMIRKRAFNSRYESLFNNSFRFTGLLEPDGTVIELNDTLVELSEFDPNESTGKQFADIPWWTHSEAVHERIETVIDRVVDGESVQIEIDAQGVNGLSTIDFSAKPITDNSGEVRQIIVEGRDISTQRLQAQHLQVLNRVIRHNIRNDIMTLRARTQKAARAPTTKKRISNARKAEATLDSWEKMTADLRDIRQVVESEHTHSRIEALGPMLREVVNEQQVEYPEAEITLENPESGEIYISSAIRRAFQETVDNAIKANASEIPTVEIAICDTDADWVEVEISDNGPGMPDTEVAVLESGEERSLIHGKGLGIWMVRMIVKQAGGEVAADVTDTGTTVIFSLRKKRHDEEPKYAAEPV